MAGMKAQRKPGLAPSFRILRAWIGGYSARIFAVCTTRRQRSISAIWKRR